jgi:hypothetical protein
MGQRLKSCCTGPHVGSCPDRQRGEREESAMQPWFSPRSDCPVPAREGRQQDRKIRTTIQCPPATGCQCFAAPGAGPEQRDGSLPGQLTDRIFIQAPDGFFMVGPINWLRVTQHNKKQSARPPTPDLPCCKTPPSMRRGETARSFVRASSVRIGGPQMGPIARLVTSTSEPRQQLSACICRLVPRWREQPASELSDYTSVCTYMYIQLSLPYCTVHSRGVLSDD